MMTQQVLSCNKNTDSVHHLQVLIFACSFYLLFGSMKKFITKMHTFEHKCVMSGHRVAFSSVIELKIRIIDPLSIMSRNN